MHRWVLTYRQTRIDNKLMNYFKVKSPICTSKEEVINLRLKEVRWGVLWGQSVKMFSCFQKTLKVLQQRYRVKIKVFLNKRIVRTYMISMAIKLKDLFSLNFRWLREVLYQDQIGLIRASKWIKMNKILSKDKGCLA